jgi:hypothetical protein
MAGREQESAVTAGCSKHVKRSVFRRRSDVSAISLRAQQLMNFVARNAPL